ncbi:MAG: ABC transporter ATP-binding protein [Candidatus Aminicenantaceae bacterium]
MDKLLELENITKRFRHPSRPEEVTVLEDLSMEIAAGEAIAVVGPSGSGKSTLLNIMGALDRPSSGTVRLEGTDLALLGDQELSRIRNREIGYVFQLHYLLPHLTVLENVQVPSLPLGPEADRSDVRNRAVQLLERIGLGEHLDHFPAQLSGGELQRVSVMRALINRPRLLLADEPTGSLDRAASQNLGELLVRLNREEDTALVVVTHSEELAGLLNPVYALVNGKLEKITRS